jgi:hypothetical protein
VSLTYLLVEMNEQDTDIMARFVGNEVCPQCLKRLVKRRTGHTFTDFNGLTICTSCMRAVHYSCVQPAQTWRCRDCSEDP